MPISPPSILSHDELADLTLADMLPRFGAKYGCSNVRKKYEPTLPDVILWMPSLRCITFEIKVSIEDYRADAAKRGMKIGDEFWYVCPAGMIDRVQGGDGLMGGINQFHRTYAQMRLMLHLLARGERGGAGDNTGRAPMKRAGSIRAPSHASMPDLESEVDRRGRVPLTTAARLAGMPVRELTTTLRDHPTFCIVEEASIRYVQRKGEGR